MEGGRAASRASGTPRRVVVAVDVGGTKIASAIADASGELSAPESVATAATGGADAVLEQVVAGARRASERARNDGEDVVGVAVASPGVIDPATGEIAFATPALPGWAGTGLRGRVEAATGLPVVVRNDGQAAAWGEWRCGAGRGIADLVMLALGTGIGGGVISRGTLLDGAHGAAGRIGHLSIDAAGRPCWCGGRGCVELYASGSAIARAARPAASTAADVVAAARGGDPCAHRLLDEAAEALAAAIAALVNLFDPALVVLGGGLASGAAEFLVDPAVRAARRRLPPVLARSLTVRPAALGGRAALAGVALLALEHLGA
jgi:glucokinase